LPRRMTGSGSVKSRVPSSEHDIWLCCRSVGSPNTDEVKA
jgi:hypothetical protein